MVYNEKGKQFVQRLINFIDDSGYYYSELLGSTDYNIMCTNFGKLGDIDLEWYNYAWYSFEILCYYYNDDYSLVETELFPVINSDSSVYNETIAEIVRLIFQKTEMFMVVPEVIKGSKLNTLKCYVCDPSSYNLSINIPNGVEHIWKGVFKNSDIESVNMPDSVIGIDSFAFECCTHLQRVNFSNNLRKIGMMAFNNCKKLDNVILPNSLEEIGNFVFNNCFNLHNFKMSPNTQYCSNVFTNTPIEDKYS